MMTIRRWYLSLVCAASLQAITWSIITLLRGMLIPSLGAEADVFSLQIAVIIVGLPIFLVHWRWARARESADEEESEPLPLPQPLYLYGMLAGFIAPLAANTFDLTSNMLRLALGTPTQTPLQGLSTTEAIVNSLIAIGVLSLLGIYFRRLLSQSRAAVSETDYAGVVRRLFILGMSLAGLTMTISGVINLLHWIMFRLQPEAAIGNFGDSGLAMEAARLAVGLPLWMLPWQRAQALFADPNPLERQSALRKLYLYTIVLIATLSTITNVALMLAGFLRRLLGLQAKGDIRLPLAILLGMGLLWAYHVTVLRNDERLAGAGPPQAAVRRLYLYLMAGIGLATLLVGLGAEISVLIQLLSGEGFGDALREQIAWASATLLAALPIWMLPWRRAQLTALVEDSSGVWERQSLVRRIYLYLFMLIAAITVLTSGVFIVSQLLEKLFRSGNAEGLLYGLAHAIAFSLIAIIVWMYHSVILRVDRQMRKSTLTDRTSDFKLVVVDDGDGHIGREILKALQENLPEATVQPLGLSSEAATAMGAPSNPDPAAQLAQANLIIGPWTIAAVASDIAAAVSASQARKLLLPHRPDGWEWAGVEPWDEKAVIRHALRAAQQIMSGELVKPARQLGIGALIALVIGGLLLLTMIVVPMMTVLSRID